MKYGIRTPSLNKRIAARTSVSRVFRHSLGFKAPRGFGWFTNPKKTAYNRVYNRTTFSADGLIILGITLLISLLGFIIKWIIDLFSFSSNINSDGVKQNTLIQLDSNLICPRCNSSMILRNGRRGKFYGCQRFPHCRGTRNYTEV